MAFQLSLVKLPLIFLVALSLHTCYKLPNPAPSKDERLPMKETSFFPVRYKMKAKILFWVAATVEAAAILVSNYGPRQRYDETIYLTTASALGALMTIAGAHIRNQCYTAMGPMFTVEVSIKKNHKLVTHGPYSVVRHPSYTGSFLATTGAFLWYFSRGSLLREWNSIATQFLAVAFVPMFISTFLVLWFRIDKEDNALKEKFGVEWEDWARRVPYKLIPLIY